MAGSISGLFPNPDNMLVLVSEVVVVLLGLTQGYSNAKGTGWSYSKFVCKDGPKKQHFESKAGFFILYFPAAFFASMILASEIGLFPLASILSAVGASSAASLLEVSTADVRVLLVAAALSSHFTKRVLEALFVHKYSGTMDAADALFISFAYTFCALTLLYVQLISCSYPAPLLDVKWLGLAVFLFGLVGNGYHHWLLSQLRKDGSKKYVIPHGGLFDQVVCPHYLFEIVDFIGVALMSQTVFGWCLSCCVLFYLGGRAIGTKEWYMKKMDGFPKDRKILIPKIF